MNNRHESSGSLNFGLLDPASLKLPPESLFVGSGVSERIK